jgi:hypothetical protein
MRDKFDLSTKPDAWGQPTYVHPSVGAFWYGWKACAATRPPVADTAINGEATVPHFRGYALMGAGAYLLQMCDGDERGPELVIYPATEDEKIGRGVGDLGTEIKTEAIPIERIAIRLQFASLEGLGALEQQLAFIREELNKRHGVAATTGAGGAMEALVELVEAHDEFGNTATLSADRCLAAWSRARALTQSPATNKDQT